MNQFTCLTEQFINTIKVNAQKPSKAFWLHVKSES